MRDVQENARHRSITHFAPLIIWIGVILFLSSPEGSMSQTSRFIRPLLEFLFPSASVDQIQLLHGYIRKVAHFTEYGVLGLLAFRVFADSNRLRLQVYRSLACIALVAFIACVDEFNQSFEPARTSSSWDVLIDISGGLFVLLLCYAAVKRRR